MSTNSEKQEETGIPEPVVQAGQVEEGPLGPLPHDHGLIEQEMTSVTTLKAALEEAKHKTKELNDQVLRMHAELQNLQRVRDRDVSHAHRYALERFLGALLPAVDSLEQAVTLNPEKGIELTLKMILETLKKFGIEVVNPTGGDFDPNFHEAMTIQEDETVPENTVLSVFQKGYVLNGRLLRPARVMVSKKRS